MRPNNILFKKYFFNKTINKDMEIESFNYNKYNSNLLNKNLITQRNIDICAMKAAYMCIMVNNKVYFNKDVFLKCIEDHAKLPKS